MTNPSATTMEIGLTSTGTPELRRLWSCQEPWALILIIHGLAEHSGRWATVGTRLARAGIETRSFDLLGFGGSGGNRADLTGWEIYRHQILDNLALLFDRGSPVVLFGHSMGGLIALDYALSRHRQPDLLVLNAPALDAVVPTWKRRAASLLAGYLPSLTLANPFDSSQIFLREEAAQDYDSDPLIARRSTLRLGSHLLQAMTRVDKRLGSLVLPSLVTHGEDDTLVPQHFTEALGRHPYVDRQLYPGLRHASIQELEGTQVIDDIVAWISERAQVGGP